MARKRIGELLIERGAIGASQLEHGLAHQQKTRQRLGVALIQLGFLTEATLSQVLSDALGVPTVDLSSTQPEWAAIHTLRPRFCETHDLFPYALETSKNRKLLVVAMSDPMNLPALEEIEFTTGLKPSPRIATLSAVRKAIMKYYHKVDPDQPAAQGRKTVRPEGTTDVVDEEVIQGEPLGDSRPTGRSELASFIKRREAQARALRAGAKPGSSVAKDLDFLFGARDEGDPIEALERRFWALMRLMAKKGLITKDEFAAELDEELK